MRESKIESHSAKCPFYLYETPTRITCSAEDIGIPAIVLRFEDPEEASLHRRAFCNSLKGYRECEFCRLFLAAAEDE